MLIYEDMKNKTQKDDKKKILIVNKRSWLSYQFQDDFFLMCLRVSENKKNILNIFKHFFYNFFKFSFVLFSTQ